MQIDLPPELEPFVEQEFATGRYATREEVVVQAVRWLRNERLEAVSGIKQGLDDMAAGRTQPLAEAIAGEVMKRYVGKEIDQIYLVYNEFKSAIQARPVIQRLLTVGGPSAAAGIDFNGEHRHFAERAALAGMLGETLGSDDSVLIKGSRTSLMDRVVAALRAEEQAC